MSTKKPKKSSVLDGALATMPNAFRAKLIKAYEELKKNAVEGRHDPAGLAAGKFCETMLRFLQNKILGTYTPFGKQIPNFPGECRKLIEAPETKGSESERVVMPRALVFLYTMRNKRGIGHVGGDVDANAIDIGAMAKTADWIVCESIRLYHGLSLEEAQDIIDGLVVRQLPTVWEVAGKKRILKPGLVAKDEALLLLYSTRDSTVLSEELCDWIEYSSLKDFKRFILTPLHKARLLEYDRETESITLSPSGADEVERRLL